MNTESWVEKHRPKTLSDVVGNPQVIKELKEWAQEWTQSWKDKKDDNPKNIPNIPKDRAIILYGKNGTGKTTAAYALANDMGWEIVELDASDQRTKSKIENVVGKSSIMGTMDGSIRLIILDEADNFHVIKDRGGEQAAIALIKKTRQPMILIANDFYKMSYNLRTLCKSMQFKPIWTDSIINVLKTVAKSENVTYDPGVIEKIADNSNGDLRGAINDLQSACENMSHVKLEDIVTGERDSKKDIFKVLEKIFKGESANDAYKAIFDIDKDPEEMIQWISENVHHEYTRPEELEKAYYYLSRSGLFLSRVRRLQDYNMWKYASLLMTAGVFVSKSGKRHTEFSKFQKPRIKDILWNTRSKRDIRDSLAKKIGDHCHTSIGFAMTNLFPFFKLMMKNESYASYISVLLELSIEEISFIMDSNPEAKMVQNAYNKAQLVLKGETDSKIESSSEINERLEKEKIAGKWGKAQTTIEDAWGI